MTKKDRNGLSGRRHAAAIVFLLGVVASILSGQRTVAAGPDVDFPRPARDIVNRLPAGVTPPAPFPPPPGSGDAPVPVTQGDGGGPTPPPTGQADRTNGSHFGTVPERAKAPGVGDPEGGQGASPHQDSPPFQGDPVPGPLPTIRWFCRYLVISGVVCACIFMIFTACSVTLGHRDSGQRVIASAGGLMLLLMGYTIWRLVYMHITGTQPNGPWDQVYRRPPPQLVNLQPADTPVVPGGGGGARRSGPPVLPLGAGLNH